MNNIFRLRRNSLQLKILSIFFVGFIVLSSGLTYLSITNNRRLNVLYNDRLNEETAALKKLINSDSKLSEALASDYSVWDDPYNYLNGKNPDYAKINLTQNVLDTFNSDAMWMFYNDGRLASKINSVEDSTGVIDFSSFQNNIKQKFSLKPEISFYIPTKAGVMQIYGSTVVTSDDGLHVKNSPGYLLVGKLINDNMLSRFKDSEMYLVKLLTPTQIKGYPLTLPVSEGTLPISISIDGINGERIGYIYANYYASTIQQLHDSDVFLLYVNSATFLSLFVVILYFILVLVIRPLGIVSKSLETKDKSFLDKLMKKNTEFGSIANLIYKFFEQEVLSQKESEEKKKLFYKLTASKTEIESTNKVMIGREIKMIDLKKEIEVLKAKLEEKS